MKKIIKFFSILIFIFIFFCSGSLCVFAYTPYENYTFTPEGKRVYEPQAVTPVRIITGEDIGAGEISGLSDIYITESKFYISDSGNNRIIVTDLNFNLIKIITSFNNNGTIDTLNNPDGIFVTDNEELYICDYGNHRIVALDSDDNLKVLVDDLNTELLDDDFIFLPKSVVVDSAERIFVVAENVNQGIIELNAAGEFQNFFGPIKVSKSWWEIFKTMFSTAEQKEKMTVTVPTEYSNIDINSTGFVYGTVSVFDRENFDESIFIHKLNPIGNDILNRNGYASPMGDVDYEIDSETKTPLTSKLIDIKSYEDAFYSVLDEEKGRVFTYNEQGYLLYVFGSLGDNLGQLTKPVALEVSNDNYYVADFEENHIVEYKLTEYGYNIKMAVLAEQALEYEQAEEYWNKVLLNTSKSYFAYNQIGTTALKNGNYEEAMQYLKIANNQANYSVAYSYLRDNLITDNFTLIAIIVIVVVIVLIARKIIKVRRKSK